MVVLQLCLDVSLSQRDLDSVRLKLQRTHCLANAVKFEWHSTIVASFALLDRLLTHFFKGFHPPLHRDPRQIIANN